MSTLDADDIERLGRMVEHTIDTSLRPIRDAVALHALAIFGEDGRGGLTKEVAEARGFAKIGAAGAGIVIGILGFFGITGYPPK